MGNWTFQMSLKYMKKKKTSTSLALPNDFEIESHFGWNGCHEKTKPKECWQECGRRVLHIVSGTVSWWSHVKISLGVPQTKDRPNDSALPVLSICQKESCTAYWRGSCVSCWLQRQLHVSAECRVHVHVDCGTYSWQAIMEWPWMSISRWVIKENVYAQ